MCGIRGKLTTIEGVTESNTLTLVLLQCARGSTTCGSITLCARYTPCGAAYQSATHGSFINIVR